MNLDKIKKIKNLKLWSVIGLLFVGLPVVMVVVDPLLVFVKYATRISEGSTLFEMMKTEVAGAHIYGYIFNITNPDDFLAGKDKLRVEEVGPFTYQEYRRTEDLELDEEESLVRYTLRTRTKFLPEKSVADPNEVNITAANLVSLAIASKVSAFPFLTRTGFNIIVNRVKSKSVINVSAHQLMWGYEDPLVELSQSILPWWMKVNNLGILDQFLNENMKTRVEMSIKNKDKFQIKTVNESPGLVSRGYDNPSKRTRCNTFNDTYEGVGFPPGLQPDTPIRVHREPTCRIFDFEYANTEVLDYGPKVFKYKLNKRAFSTTPATECLCSSQCINGITDLSPCFHGLSLALSNAHFLHADPSVYEGIDGIRPEEEKHESFILVDTVSGMTLKTKLSLQLNVVVDNVKYSSVFKSFSNMVVPVAYFQVTQPEFDEYIKTKIKLLYVVGRYAILTIEVVLFAIGTSILLCIGYVKYDEAATPGRKNISYHIPDRDMEKTETNDSQSNAPRVNYDKLHVIN